MTIIKSIRSTYRPVDKVQRLHRVLHMNSIHVADVTGVTIPEDYIHICHFIFNWHKLAHCMHMNTNVLFLFCLGEILLNIFYSKTIIIWLSILCAQTNQSKCYRVSWSNYKCTFIYLVEHWTEWLVSSIWTILEKGPFKHKKTPGLSVNLSSCF